MKSRETALRLKRFEADEKARKVADLQHMIHEFEIMARDLDRQIAAEEDRTGVRDRAHFSYSTYAKAASQRRDNLVASVAELRDKLEVAERERDEAMEQLSRVGVVEQEETTRTSTTRRNDRSRPLQFG
jgi:hypothetical protein